MLKFGLRWHLRTQVSHGDLEERGSKNFLKKDFQRKPLML